MFFCTNIALVLLHKIEVKPLEYCSTEYCNKVFPIVLESVVALDVNGGSESYRISLKNLLCLEDGTTRVSNE